MNAGSEPLASPQQALETYLDGLLTPPVNDGASTAAPAAVPGYLIFRLAQLDFAVPAARIETVLPWPPTDALPAPAAAGWIGRILYGGRVIDVADTASYLLPAVRRPAPAAGRVLLLGATTLGLVCDSVNADPEYIDPRQVCWRGTRGTRPWLAGTLAARRCALIDPDGLLAVLDRARPVSDPREDEQP